MDFICRTEFEGEKIPVLAAVMQIFIDFHQGPPLRGHMATALSATAQVATP